MKKLPQAHAMDIFLQPGEFYFGDHFTRIRTILGSASRSPCGTRVAASAACAITCCPVAAPRRGSGSTVVMPMRRCNYFCTKSAPPAHGRTSTKSNCSAAAICSGPRGRKRKRRKKTPGGDADCRDVPCRNRQIAYQLIQRYGFTLTAEHLGGSGHRQLMFDIASGHAWVRQNPIATSCTVGTSS